MLLLGNILNAYGALGRWFFAWRDKLIGDAEDQRRGRHFYAGMHDLVMLDRRDRLAGHHSRRIVSIGGKG